MSKQKETGDESKPAKAQAALPWNAHVRGIVSVFLAAHVAAVFIAPWSFPEPSSELAEDLGDFCRPYLHLLGINNGYRFFAPDPGPSHLVQYRLHMWDGSIQEGRFTDLEEHWPRQLYHRHLMIAETVSIATTGIFPEPPLPSEDPSAGRRHEEVKKELIQPIAQQLMRQHDAEAVELWSIRHALPTREMVLDGAMLTDPQSYLERPLGMYRRK